MRQLLLPAVSQTLVIQRVLYTASQLYNGTAMLLLLLFRCLVCPDKTRVFSILRLSLSPPPTPPFDPVCDTALCDVMFFAGPTGGTKIMFHISADPRDLRNKKFQYNTQKFAAVLLGAFAQSRKSPVSFVVSVRPSVHKYQHHSHCTDFCESYYRGLMKICRETRNLVKIGQNYRTLDMKTCLNNTQTNSGMA
jgi:hypothetical protein